MNRAATPDNVVKNENIYFRCPEPLGFFEFP